MRLSVVGLGHHSIAELPLRLHLLHLQLPLLPRMRCHLELGPPLRSRKLPQGCRMHSSRPEENCRRSPGRVADTFQINEYGKPRP